MNGQIAYVIETLEFIQDGKIFTWRTPLLAIQYLGKLVFEKIGSVQSPKLQFFPLEDYGEYSLLTARDLADVEKAQALYEQSFADKHGSVILRELFKEFPKLFFITLKGKTLVGYCVYTIDPSIIKKCQTACLYSMAVDAGYRGSGHARHMMERTLDYLRKNSFTKVYLHVYPDNKNAIKLYQSFGFKLMRVVKTINPKRNHMWLMEASIQALMPD